MAISIFEYLYRDASNYKAWGAVLLEGQVTQNHIDRIKRCMESGEFFVADEVGLPSLREELFEYSDGPTSEDHSWHEFHDFRAATADEVRDYSKWGTVTKLVAAFEAACKSSSWLP